MAVKQVYYEELARKVSQLLQTLPLAEFPERVTFCFKDLVVARKDYCNVLEKAPSDPDVVYDQLKLLQQLLESALSWRMRAAKLMARARAYEDMGLIQLANDYHAYADYAWKVYKSLLREVECNG